MLYRLELDVIDDELLACIIDHMREKLEMPLTDVWSELMFKGIPILAEDCAVEVSDPQRLV